MAYTIPMGNPWVPGVYEGLYSGARSRENFVRQIENSKIELARRREETEQARLALAQDEAEFRKTVASRDFAAKQQEIADSAARWRAEHGLKLRQETRLEGAAHADEWLKKAQVVETQAKKAALARKEENELRDRGFKLYRAGARPGDDETIYMDTAGRVWLGKTAAAREVATALAKQGVGANKDHLGFVRAKLEQIKSDLDRRLKERDEVEKELTTTETGLESLKRRAEAARGPAAERAQERLRAAEQRATQLREALAGRLSRDELLTERAYYERLYREMVEFPYPEAAGAPFPGTGASAAPAGAAAPAATPAMSPEEYVRSVLFRGAGGGRRG